MGQFFKGTRLYLNNFDEYFPLAWHEGAGDTVDAVTYSRFLIHAAIDTNIQYADAQDDAARAAELFTNTVLFWHDPATGLTNDFFSPPSIFRLPEPCEMAKPYDRHTLYTDLTSRVSSVEMPFLAQATASTPQPGAATDVPEETRTGIPGAFKSAAFLLNGKSYDAFYGVARSWSDIGRERFDFRRKGSVCVGFLDGRVDVIKKEDRHILDKIHRNWNAAPNGRP